MTAKTTQIDNSTSKTEGVGALGINNFTRIHRQEHPSVRAMNAYTEHLRENMIGYATYVPDTQRGVDSPFTWKSKTGQRLLNAFESGPVYFADEWEDLRRASTIRLSKKPLDQEVLAKELALKSMTFEELVANAKNLSVYESSKDKTKPGLVNACLLAEFGADRVKSNTAKEI